MWLSRQMRPRPVETDVDLGMTTIQGENVGVLTRGEIRNLPIYGPGGYIWLPKNGMEVLVIKGGPGGEEHCVNGMMQCPAPQGMQPGEVYLYGPNQNTVYLKQDGSIELRGTVEIWGNLVINGVPYRPCYCDEGDGF